MMKSSENKIKEIGLALTAVAAGFLVQKLLESGYKSIYKEAPPNAVSDEKVHWGKVLGWVIVSGFAVSATKIFIKRGGARKL